MPMNFGSVCSGIEAASIAWEPLGWRCAFVSEVDRFPCALLSHYWPSVPNYGDLNECAQWPAHAIDVLVGGTPCQDFSVAGQRAGMGGARGGLTMRFLDCVERFAPTWVLWENVPGVLSSNGGRDFGAFLGGLAKRGYGFAYRVLDAQYFGLAQRRQRVFVVGCAGGAWQRAAAVLFDAPRMCWNPPPRRETGKRVADTVANRARGGGWPGTDEACDGAVIPIQEIGKRCSGTPENGVGYGQPGDPMFTIQATAQHGVCHTLSAEGYDASEDGTGRGVPLVTAPVTSNQYGDHESRESLLVPVAFDMRGREGGSQLEGPHDTANVRASSGGSSRSYVQQPVAFQESEYGTHELPIAGSQRADRPGHTSGVRSGMAVRRLTPREVERLMGFPDDYTLIPYRGKPACDGPRYRALGNAMPVPVMRWLGQRIELVEGIERTRNALSRRAPADA